MAPTIKDLKEMISAMEIQMKQNHLEIVGKLDKVENVANQALQLARETQSQIANFKQEINDQMKNYKDDISNNITNIIEENTTVKRIEAQKKGVLI